MRIMHTGGFSKMERKQWRVIIFSNLVNAFQILLAAMDEQDTEFEDEDNFVRSVRSVFCPSPALTFPCSIGRSS